MFSMFQHYRGLRQETCSQGATVGKVIFTIIQELMLSVIGSLMRKHCVCLQQKENWQVVPVLCVCRCWMCFMLCKDVVMCCIVLVKWHLRLSWVQQQGCMVCQGGCLVWTQQFLYLTVGSEEHLFFSASWGLNGDLERAEGREDPGLVMNLLFLWSGHMVKGQNRIHFRKNKSWFFPKSHDLYILYLFHPSH